MFLIGLSDKRGKKTWLLPVLLRLLVVGRDFFFLHERELTLLLLSVWEGERATDQSEKLSWFLPSWSSSEASSDGQGEQEAQDVCVHFPAGD